MINSGALLEIKINNLIYNYKIFSKLAKNSITAATIKANAYGLGDLKIFKTLFDKGCRNFFVATTEEALKIKERYTYGKIYVLNGINEKEIGYIRNKKIIPVINSLENLNLFDHKENKKLEIAIHIDTGINRLGINEDDIPKINFDKYNIDLLISHLASADEINNKYNQIQQKKFEKISKKLNFIKNKSLSNSLGTLINNKFHYTMIRPGIALYGGYYNNLKLKKLIKPVVKLKAKVIQIKKLKKNQFVGYNQTFKTSKITTIALLGIGYADGISRKLSNKGKVYYKDKSFNIIGRVSMDTITIDITKHKNIIKKDVYMEIINYKNDIEKLAKQCETISNEILTSISNRVKRIYV
ncbi:MAG: Alanine racemase 1 [Alphaproteobacteria bacterium MarineAlpha5_Bin6]|nr:MAG: Alanine racemase 1 [Alphaproteobacteria bacterium MarineAlpha5_Bin7]PPR53334.1 MAG: Alanine racemase 1 [Alphaproteobacteria bacterium MarineAlpha5_Bin6]|tara:strand:+ start:3647 stop:4711 length:1065 start_codon:yes stop_codon:yes gene_type:complete